MSIFRKISVFSLFIVLSLLTNWSFSDAAEKCFKKATSCSCEEAENLYLCSLSNNPHLIEKNDLINCRADISDSCINEFEESVQVSSFFRQSSGFHKFIQKIDDRYLKNYIQNFYPKKAEYPICVTKKYSNRIPSRFKKELLPDAENIDGIRRIDLKKIKEENCLVYLPNRFIQTEKDAAYEMDVRVNSFIASLILLSNRVNYSDLAKDIIDNFVYEIEYFGYPVEGNRGYKLSRSQNNIIPSLFLEYFNKTKDYNWLEYTAVPAVEKILDYWNTRIGIVILNDDPSSDKKNFEGYRWFASGKGPRTEVWSKADDYDPYYFKLLSSLIKIALTRDPERKDYAKGFDYNRIMHVISNERVETWKKQKRLIPISLHLKAENEKYYVLKSKNETKSQPVIRYNNVFYIFTETFFSNDRAKVVSSFNNHLYGPYNAFVDQFVDVVHSLQTYKANRIMAKMYTILAEYYGHDSTKGSNYQEEVELYNSEADEIKRVLFKYMLDEESGIFYNYNSYSDSKRDYLFAGSLYTLWAGFFDIKSSGELSLLEKSLDSTLKALEGSEGICASNVSSDLPFDKPGLDTIQNITIIGGLKNYAKELRVSNFIKKASKLDKIKDRLSIKSLYRLYKKYKDASLIHPSDIAAISYLYGNLSDVDRQVLGLAP